MNDRKHLFDAWGSTVATLSLLVSAAVGWGSCSAIAYDRERAKTDRLEQEKRIERQEAFVERLQRQQQEHETRLAEAEQSLNNAILTVTPGGNFPDEEGGYLVVLANSGRMPAIVTSAVVNLTGDAHPEEKRQRFVHNISDGKEDDIIDLIVEESAMGSPSSFDLDFRKPIVVGPFASKHFRVFVRSERLQGQVMRGSLAFLYNDVEAKEELALFEIKPVDFQPSSENRRIQPGPTRRGRGRNFGLVPSGSTQSSESSPLPDLPK